MYEYDVDIDVFERFCVETSFCSSYSPDLSSLFRGQVELFDVTRRPF